MGNFNSLAALKRAIESSTTGVVIADTTLPEKPLTYVNPAFEKLTGYSNKYSIGKNCRFLQGPDTDAKQVDKIRRAINKGIACKTILLNYKKDGTKFWNELSISPIDENGKVVGFIGIQDDITARVEVEQALVKAKFDAETANNLKADFLNVISHELRTPLTVMLGNLPLLTNPNDMPDNEEVAEIAVDIEEASKHLLKLINELLDVSKIEAGKLQLAVEPLSMSNCIQNALYLMQPLITSKGLQLFKNIEDFTFMGDPIRMKQVIINLLGNAVKFTDKGSITLSVKSNGNIGQLNISDTGCGIKEEYISKIFEAFKQVDSSTTRVASGSGLGLAISKRLIELQEGTISVKSKYGIGSDFCISIPIMI